MSRWDSGWEIRLCWENDRKTVGTAKVSNFVRPKGDFAIAKHIILLIDG